MNLTYLHTMVRVTDIDASLKFYCEGLGLQIVRRVDIEAGRFTLVFLASPDDIARAGGIPENTSPTAMDIPIIELTHNWGPEVYDGGRNFGPLAYRVGNIYEANHVTSILLAGRADLVCLARPHLSDSYWTLRSAAQIGDRLADWPLRYGPGKDQLWRLADKAAEMAKP